MTAEAPITEQIEQPGSIENAERSASAVADRSGRLADLDRDQLQQHIQSLQQKLARQKAKQGGTILSEEQQRKLLELLNKQRERESLGTDLRSLISRATELNQKSEQIQQEIHGLNIVSENATNKCSEITYGAQHVIDQNEKLQKTLSQHLERSVEISEQCQELAEQLGRSLEGSELSQQKMDSATDRAQTTNEKSKQLLDELTESKHDIAEQVALVHQVTELCSRTNSESELLHKQLEGLGNQISENIAENAQQMINSNKVLESCGQLAGEINETKVNTERVLLSVESSNTESQELIGKMSDVLESAEAKQQQNRALNLDLQHSLQRNQQQREELTVLTSECREVRDQTQETQKQNEATIKGSLEKLSVALAETRQGKLQVERTLKEVFEGNHQAKELIERMGDLTASSTSTQEENIRLNGGLQNTLEQCIGTREELVELVDTSRVARDKTEEVLQTSVQINSDAQSSIARLNDYMDGMRSTRDELKSLISTTQKTNEDATESLDAMRTNINNSTMIQKECIRLNKESVATTLEAKRTSEKLTGELESSFKLNKHYQDRMKAAEKKYQAAVEAEGKYQELYENALKALRENESLLEQTRATMKEYGDSSVEYNNTIKEFQQTTVQSQQIILETQASIKTLINNNEQLAEENRFLKGQIRKTEPTPPDNVWPTMDTELQSDSGVSNSFDRKVEQLGRYEKNY